MRKKWMVCVVAVAGGLAGLARADGEFAKQAAIEAFGKGVQIYTCTASNGTYAWTLKAPAATLQDARGKVIGKHFGGPTWQASDGSSVVGEPINVSPSPDPGAIAWLVLRARSHAGAGAMANVEYIVRTRTEGGMAPASGCDASHAKAEIRVSYSAIYLFFRHGS